jgi:hypothetical protein
MAKPKKKKRSPTIAEKTFDFSFKSKQVKVILDSVLIFRVLRRLHGRFWGIAAVLFMTVGFTVCGVIRPDLIRPDAAISDFGNDIRTAPYFAGSMFFAAYGLWRWRNYLMRTLKRKRPISWFIMLTIIGLYLVALMPVSWYPVAHNIHLFGVALAGISMVATVVADSLLSKIQAKYDIGYWRLLRLLSFVLIVVGGFVTFASLDTIEWLDYTFLGEVMMIAGYAIWIFIKTYLGEGSRSQLSKLLKNIVLVD